MALWCNLASGLVVVAVAGLCVLGQDAATGQVKEVDQAEAEKPMAVFHSYTNLIQVPVLVLSSTHLSLIHI